MSPTTTLDIDALRADTPGCSHVIHLNNAGAALIPSPVANAVMDYLTQETRIGGYETTAARLDELEDTYHALATLINARPDEIAFMENATRAWDMAFYGIPFSPGDVILTSVSEYASNMIAFLQVAQKTGAVVQVIPNDAFGQTSVSALAEMIHPQVKLIAITHIPTNGGLVNPAAEIGALAREHNILYLLDACQSVGQMPIDVEAIGCDFLSATGRKYLRGPRGTGFLYVRRERLNALEPPLLDLHAATWVAPDRYEMRPDARRFETWETHYAGKLGLGVAARYALNLGLPAIWDRIHMLASRLRSLLHDLDNVTVQDLGQVQCGIVSFSVTGMAPRDLQQALRQQNINISVSPREYTLNDMRQRGLETILRASVHYYNTDAELQQFATTLDRLLHSQ